LYDEPLKDSESSLAWRRGQGSEQGFVRHKVWDACYYAAYARVGGGMNARPEFWKRFRNRFHCKFMNFPNEYGFNACSGCGRCFSVCMGKIDIRKILEKI
jgi:ferredoxin